MDTHARSLEYVSIGGGACILPHARTSSLLVPSHVPAVKMSPACILLHITNFPES